MLRALVIAFLCLSAVPAWALDSDIARHVPEARLVGQGRLNLFTFKVYDAALYAPKGHLKEGQPLALKLTYLRPIKGQQITDRTFDEMEEVAQPSKEQLDSWMKELSRIFPDVQPGNSITGIYDRKGHTLFYKDGQKIGQINDPAFGPAFFDIWLSPKTNAPNLRRKLLGQAVQTP